MAACDAAAHSDKMHSTFSLETHPLAIHASMQGAGLSPVNVARKRAMSSTSSGTYTAFSPSCCSAALWMAGLRLQQRQVGRMASVELCAPECSSQVTHLQLQNAPTKAASSLVLPTLPAHCNFGGLPSPAPAALSTHLWLTGLPTMPMTAVSCRCCFSPYMPLSCCSVGWPGAAWQGQGGQAAARWVRCGKKYCFWWRQAQQAGHSTSAPPYQTLSLTKPAICGTCTAHPAPTAPAAHQTRALATALQT